MKFKLFFLLLFSIFTLNAQDKSLNYSVELEPYIIEFINEGLKRDVKVVDTIFSRLDNIVTTSNLKYPQLGFYSAYNKTILISDFTQIDTLAIKVTLFHELGHVLLGIGHSCKSCTDIMSQYGPRSFSIYADKVLWSEELDKFYKLIKQKLKQ